MHSSILAWGIPRTEETHGLQSMGSQTDMTEQPSMHAPWRITSWMLQWKQWNMAGLWVYFSVQFSRSVVSDSLRPHELQHPSSPCPSPTPGVHPNPCPLSWWCHPAISSSVVPFSSCPQSFPASGSFQMSQLFTSGGQELEFQLQHQSFQWTPRTGLL